jgi:hypothetical protein
MSMFDRHIGIDYSGSIAPSFLNKASNGKL